MELRLYLRAVTTVRTVPTERTYKCMQQRLLFIRCSHTCAAHYAPGRHSTFPHKHPLVRCGLSSKFRQNSFDHLLSLLAAFCSSRRID